MTPRQTDVSVGTSMAERRPGRDRVARVAAIGRCQVRQVAALSCIFMVVALSGSATASGATPSHSPSVEVAGPSVAGLEPGGLVTEPVVDGVVRVVGDGMGRDLGDGRNREVEIGPDGVVWVARGARVVALGRPGVVEPRTQGWQSVPRRLSVSPDGVLWAMEDGGTPVSLEAGSWMDRSDDVLGPGGSLGVVPDGSIWRVIAGPDGNHLAELTADGWVTHESPELAKLLDDRRPRLSFAGTSDGLTWLGVDRRGQGGGLASFDGVVRSVIEAIGPYMEPRVFQVAVAPDGALWVLADVTETRGTVPLAYMLARFDGRGWTTWTGAEGMPQDQSLALVDGSPVLPTPMVVGPDGTVWFSIERVGFDHVRRLGVLTGRRPQPQAWGPGSRGRRRWVDLDHWHSRWALRAGARCGGPDRPALNDSHRSVTRLFKRTSASPGARKSLPWWSAIAGWQPCAAAPRVTGPVQACAVAAPRSLCRCRRPAPVGRGGLDGEVVAPG